MLRLRPVETTRANALGVTACFRRALAAAGLMTARCARSVILANPPRARRSRRRSPNPLSGATFFVDSREGLATSASLASWPSLAGVTTISPSSVRPESIAFSGFLT